MRYIVDRIEGGVAVLERDDLAFEDVPLSKLPEGTAQHDCLEYEGGAWRIDRERTEERKRAIAEKMGNLFS